jgi:prephenate dehydratase
VEDIPENETRFAWLAPVDPDAADARSAQPPDSDGAWKTSIVFWGLPDAPGSLVEVLQEFAAREVNLSRIESRPRKQGLGRYIFFADLEGHCSEERIAGALAVVGKSVETLRVLGCYPAFVPRGR